MAPARSLFTNERAPCGRIVNGDRYQDRDDHCLVSDEWFFACGCRDLRHEYHDGGVSRKVIRHDGSVVVDELIPGG